MRRFVPLCPFEWTRQPQKKKKRKKVCWELISSGIDWIVQMSLGQRFKKIIDLMALTIQENQFQTEADHFAEILISNKLCAQMTCCS